MKKRILVLEDDDAIGDLLKFYFEDLGHEAQISLTVANFNQIINSFRPDLITLDILLLPFQ